MPWTLSHPAAVLPLRRLSPRPLVFAALVVGSMTPDIGYYIDRFDLADFAHTLPGSFIACLPTGVIMLFIFYLFSKPFCYALPEPHRQSLLPLCPNFPTSLASWAMILLSLLLGAWTHNFWDAFTHEHGWFVERIPWLQPPVMRITSTNVQMFLLLQEFSTIAGFVIVVVAYGRWLRRQRPNRAANSEGDGWRYFFWAAVIGLALVISLPTAVDYAIAESRHGFLFLRSVLFQGALYSARIIVPLSLIGTAVIYARRRRET
jgi:hypothetical protein